MARRAVPGDLLGKTADGLEAGQGCYERDGRIFASACGAVSEESGRLEVTSAALSRLRASVLEVGDVVSARVLKITDLQAFVGIFGVVRREFLEGSLADQAQNSVEFGEDVAGVVRRENVREKDIDRVKMADSFRPGDIIRARVVSLGTSRQYFLSTAETDLGVCWAKGAERGGIMLPVSPTEVLCAGTGERELRECAQPRARDREGGVSGAS